MLKDSNFDYNNKATPEVHMAPENKEINISKYGKKKQEIKLDPSPLSEEDLIGTLIDLMDQYLKPQPHVLYSMNPETELRRLQKILNQMVATLAFMRIAEYKERHK